MTIIFQEKRWFFSSQESTQKYLLTDISKGGLCFVCNESLVIGNKLVVQLLMPDDTSFKLNSVVKNQYWTGDSNKRRTGIEFMTFLNRCGWNSRKSLDILSRLDKQYAGN